MNRKNRTWQPIDPAAGGLPEGLESALGDGDSVSACVVVLVDSEIDSEWGALASLAIAKRWAESGRRVILADACLDRPVLHEVAGVENGEGVSDVMLLGASLERIAEPLGERLFLVPAGTPVDQVADVLTHIEWDIVIRGCKRAGATLVFHVSTGTPGAQSLTERAEGVLVLAPSSQDLDTIVGSESGPLIAVLGPGNRGDPSAAGLPGPALADPAGEGFGSDETPEPAFAEPGGGDFSLDEEDALAVEGLPESPEEPPAFSVDDPLELPSSEGEDGEISDAFSVPSLEGSQYDAGDSRDAALEADVPEAEAVVSEAEESTEASGTPEGGDVSVGTADLDSGSDLEVETSVEGETPLVEPVPVSDSLAEVEADGSPIEDALAVDGLPELPEEPPAFSVDDPPELLSSEGEDGETSDAFSVPSLEGSQYDAGDSRDAALEADAPEAGAVVSEAEESTEASGTAEGGDLGVGTADLDSGSDLEVETSVEGETPLVEPLPVSDSLAEVGAEESPIEDALAVEGLPGSPEEPPAFSVDDPPELPSSEGETSDAFSIPSLEGSQYDAGDSRDAALEADAPEAGAVVSEAEESTEASGTAEGGDLGVGTADLDSGSDLEVETSVEGETPLVEPLPVSDSLAEVGAEESPIEDALAVEGLPGSPEEPPAFSVDDPPELPSSEGETSDAFSIPSLEGSQKRIWRSRDLPEWSSREGEDGETSDAFSVPSLEGSQYDAGDSRDGALEADAAEAGAVVSEAEESTEASGTAEGGDLGVGTADLDSGADLQVETSVEGETPLVEPLPVSDSPAEVGAEDSPTEEPQGESTVEDAEAGRGYEGPARVEKWRKTERKTERKTGQKTEWHVLLVDDDDDDDYSLVIERSLRSAAGVPVEIRRARTGGEALTVLGDFVPDLLLLDLKMPGMGGHEVLERIKGDDKLRSVPVAVLSSSDRDEDVAKSYGFGGNHFITKPSNPLVLEAKLGALLRNLAELGGIRRGSTGASTTAVSAVDPRAMTTLKVFRWVVVVGALIALYMFGKVSGAF